MASVLPQDECDCECEDEKEGGFALAPPVVIASLLLVVEDQSVWVCAIKIHSTIPDYFPLFHPAAVAQQSVMTMMVMVVMWPLRSPAVAADHDHENPSRPP